MQQYFVDDHGLRYGRLTITGILLSIVVNILFGVTSRLGAAGGGGAAMWDAATLGLWFTWLTLAVGVITCFILWIVGMVKRRSR